jgi:hypothetical protein
MAYAFPWLIRLSKHLFDKLDGDLTDRIMTYKVEEDKELAEKGPNQTDCHDCLRILTYSGQWVLVKGNGRDVVKGQLQDQYRKMCRNYLGQKDFVIHLDRETI